MKAPAIKHIAEALALRLVPGAINVVAFIALAAWLSGEAYGLASTYIASAAAASSLLFGPLVHSALVHHAEHWSRGEQASFERTHLTNTALLCAAAGGAGLLLAFSGLFDWRIAAGAVAIGAYTAIQEISHARLQLVRFAVGSTAQSLAFLGLAFALVRSVPTVERALEAFAASYLVGLVVSVILSGTSVGRPSLRMLKAAYGIGTMPTLSNVAIDAFTLGCRYLLMAFGRLDALGTFSFSIDVAQRTVGIFVNLATFAVVPRALRETEGMDTQRLWRSLARGWAIAVVASALSAAAIIAAAASGAVSALDQAVFDAVSFALVALAVIIVRSGKMMLTPVAMRSRRTIVLLMPLLVIAPAFLGAVAIGVALQVPYSVEFGYAAALLAWVTVAGSLLVRATQRQSEARALFHR